MQRLVDLTETLHEIETVSLELVEAFEGLTDEIVHQQIGVACNHISQAKESLKSAVLLQTQLEGSVGKCG